MKRLIIGSLVLLFCISIPTTWAQSFKLDDYEHFLQSNQNLSAPEFLARYQPEQPFFKNRGHETIMDDVAYLDSIQIKYRLTEDELQLLKDNHFMVSERLSFGNFDHAMHDIYEKDLPVFVTSDAILYALHYSYDKILQDIEIVLLEKKLSEVLEAMHRSLPALVAQYSDVPRLADPLADVDLYVTMAKSLLAEKQLEPSLAGTKGVDELWQAIEAEKMTNMPLFSERLRKLDFSQFTVRGHYTNEFWDENGQRRTLGPYFQAMMWLGRMDFMLTPPPENPWEQPWTREEIRRMNLGAVLLNELVDLAAVRPLLQEIDTILTFLVNESDNLTPDELSQIVQDQGVNAGVLLDDATYDAFQAALKANSTSAQKILSSIMLMDPTDPNPGELPVSFRLMGQRFIIDSYVFANVVFDRIVYNGQKIWRPMPDPLDAMFALGNDNALPLLKDELEQYKYSSQLEALRYLVDAYDDAFWSQSLYNVWLDGIRSLNPIEDASHYPFFMQTAAWQQQKLNTQLSSWTQLRHDNLLYAKQSYTGGTGCAYPHSFVEPYPELYENLAAFSRKALSFFGSYDSDSWLSQRIIDFFEGMEPVMTKLSGLARKEIAGQAFSEQEIDWLQRMLFREMGSGAPPFSGWYADLYYRLRDYGISNYEGSDYLVADVHTQPTDQNGAMVGHVLHVGVGKINLGVFIADAPSADFQPMAYVGAVMSYYEEITKNFKRFTDKEWGDKVKAGKLPQRPDWVNIYLADAKGNRFGAGRELPALSYTGVNEQPQQPDDFLTLQNYPNPFNPGTTISYTLPQSGRVQLAIYDVLGRQLEMLFDQRQGAGTYTIDWQAGDLSSGVYFARLVTAESVKTIKMMLIK